MRTARVGLIAILVVCGFAFRMYRMFGGPTSSPGSYGDARQQMFNEAARSGPSRAKTPTRPANLDTRLPAAKAAELREVFPASKENVAAFHKVYSEIAESIWNELEAIDQKNEWYELLSPARRAIILLENLESEVNNGGFDQYYLNSSGDGAGLTPEAMRLIGDQRLVSLIERANGEFGAPPPADRNERLRRMKHLKSDSSKRWSELDDEFYKLDLPEGGLPALAVPYILRNESEFFKPI